MTENERSELRNAAIIAFIRTVAATVAVEDETGTGKFTAEEFLKLFDKGLTMRLSQPDGEQLAGPVETLSEVFRSMVRRTKSQLSMGRMIEDLFDERDIDF